MAQVESHLQTEIGLEPSQELGIRLVGSSPSAGGNSPGLKGNVVV